MQERQEMRVHPWLGKIPLRRWWQSTPAFLPGKSHGHRSLVDYSPWGLELDTTEWWRLCRNIRLYLIILILYLSLYIIQTSIRLVTNYAIRNNKLLTLLFSDELDSTVVGCVHYLTSILSSKQTEAKQYPGLPMTWHLWTQGPWISSNEFLGLERGAMKNMCPLCHPVDFLGIFFPLGTLPCSPWAAWIKETDSRKNRFSTRWWHKIWKGANIHTYIHF